ncbi:MAG: HlyC/CorC family transporter [Sphingomonadales bacterium]
MSELGFAIGAVFALLVLSAFFSGSETALTAASRARLRHMASEGDKQALVFEALVELPERFIGTILLGNNLVNILASALATSVMIELFGEAGVVYATLVMTALVLVFAEVLPKTLAISRADRIALVVAKPISLLATVLGPVVNLVQEIVRRTLSLFGIDISEKDTFLSSHEEIRGTIDLHASEGGIVKEHRDMLGSILDLDDVDIADVMVHRRNMMMIDVSEPSSDIIQQVIDAPYTRIPLYEDDPDNIIGVIHAKDILRALMKPGGRRDRVNIKSLMAEPWFVPETTSLREQLDAFTARKNHFAIVVDEYGVILGLVTLEDILEEIVGDIADEYDTFETDGITFNGDGTITVEGTVTIRDLNRRMDWTLPDEDAATVAGLLINEARVIPVKGQSFDFFERRFEVLRRQRNQVTLLKITDLTPPEQNAA